VGLIGREPFVVFGLDELHSAKRPNLEEVMQAGEFFFTEKFAFVEEEEGIDRLFLVLFWIFGGEGWSIFLHVELLSLSHLD